MAVRSVSHARTLKGSRWSRARVVLAAIVTAVVVVGGLVAVPQVVGASPHAASAGVRHVVAGSGALVSGVDPAVPDTSGEPVAPDGHSVLHPDGPSDLDEYLPGTVGPGVGPQGVEQGAGSLGVRVPASGPGHVHPDTVTVTVTSPGDHDTYTLTPYVFGTATSSAGGTVQTYFYVRDNGSSTWNIANGIEVDVASGSVASWRFPDQAGKAGGKYDWQMQACQSGTCSALTTIATFEIDPMVAAGNRSYLATFDQTLSTVASLHVNYSTGNLTVDNNDLDITGIDGLDLAFDRAYNSITDTTISRTDFGSNWTNGLMDLATGTQSGGSVRLIGPSGYLAQFTYDGTNYNAPTGLDADLNVSGSTRTITFHHDNSGFRQGDVLTFTSGLLTSIGDKSGTTLSIAYNPSVGGEVETVTDNQTGRVITLSNYNAAGQAQTVTDSSGRTLSYGYDSSGNLTSFSDAGVGTISGDAATTYQYDSSHELTQITDPSGRVTKIGYTSGQVTSVTRGYGTSDATQTVFAYYPVGNSVCSSHAMYACTTVAQDQLNEVPMPGSSGYEKSTIWFDKTGRQMFALDPAGKTQGSTWDINSNQQTITDKLTTTPLTTVNYDPAGTNNPMTIKDSTTTMKDTFTYNGTGPGYHPPYQPDTETLPNTASGSPSTTVTSSYTRIGSTTYADTTSQTQGSTTLSATYQGSGGSCSAKPGQLCSTTNGNSGLTTYTYNSHGDLTKVTPPSPLHYLTYTPDSLGRDTAIVDGKSQSTTIHYDVLDRVTEVDYPSTAKKITYTYDGDSNVTAEAVTVSGSTANYSFTYDNLNRLTHKTLPANNTGVTDDAYSYDLLGNLLTVQEYGGTSPTNISLTTDYYYDTTNALTSQVSATTDPNGVTGSTVTINYVNDGNGRRTQTTFGSPAAETQTFVYDSNGREVEDKDHHAGVGDNYDLVSCYVNPIADCPTAPSGSPASGGVETPLRQRLIDNAASLTTTYGYDQLSRLTSATQTAGGTDSRSYGYDPDGNRTSQTINGTASTFTYNSADQATSTGYAYDLNGAATATPSLSTLNYNTLNQTTSIVKSGTTTSFSYAGGSQDTRTTANTVDAALSALGPDGASVDIEANSAGTAYHFYIRDNAGNLIAIINDSTAYSTTRYVVRDTQGSVIALTDGSGNVTDTYTYDPYGNLLARTGSTYNPFGYNAQYTDTTTGLQHLGARYYNPTDGRFTQQDPANQGPNLYVYAGDNPINQADPTGRGLFGDLLEGAGVALGVGAVFATGGLALALGGLAAAADVAGGDLNGESDTQLGISAGLDVISGGIGPLGETVGIAGASEQVLAGTYAAGNSAYGLSTTYLE